MSLAKSTIEFILFEKLRSYHTPGTAVDTTTQFEGVLSADETIGVSPRQIFMNSSRYVIFINGGPKDDWPKDWLRMNCKTLAEAIFGRQQGAVEVPPDGAAQPKPATAAGPAKKSGAKTAAQGG